jgi:hypothetical protein
MEPVLLLCDHFFVAFWSREDKILHRPALTNHDGRLHGGHGGGAGPGRALPRGLLPLSSCHRPTAQTCHRRRPHRRPTAVPPPSHRCRHHFRCRRRCPMRHHQMAGGHLENAVNLFMEMGPAAATAISTGMGGGGGGGGGAGVPHGSTRCACCSPNGTPRRPRECLPPHLMRSHERPFK